MALSAEEIRQRLTELAGRWSVYDGSERSGAQTFLLELFRAYGKNPSDVGAVFEQPQAGRFVDLLWPGVCLFEMKAPGEARRLSHHRPQALDYWRAAARPDEHTPAPRFVVICAFRRMEIWEPGAYPNAPRLILDLVELPDQYEALGFLRGDEPLFLGGQEALTREAVGQISELYARLKDRRAGGPDELRSFVLQSVWCMFAEDLGQIPGHRFTQLVEQLIEQPGRSSADDLGRLFWWLDKPGERPRQGMYADTPYANGTLFSDPAEVHLDRDELALLRAACGFDWKQVEPQIFGSLLEGGLGHDKQWALGAHYTYEADIKKVVLPTIVEPWRERIENLGSLRDVVAAQNALAAYVVLDPACGSGNFLYVAYRELRRLEKRLGEREVEIRRAAGKRDDQATLGLYTLANIRGIEIDGFALALARVTLWMGHKLAVDELGLPETTLPLANLSGIQLGDALRLDWPRADAIIGNPPFHGSQHLRGLLGDDYVAWLRDEFGVGVKDYCVYWFRKAHDHLAHGSRAGLVGTNSVSQNRARGASLEYIEQEGGVINEAVSKQPWPGAAVVNVSIVNWVREPVRSPPSFLLDGVEVPGISSSLRPASGGGDAVPLTANRTLAFQGPIPVGDGFVLTLEEARTLLEQTDAPYAEVVRPYLVGEDIAGDPAQAPRRAVVDFGLRTLEETMAYPRALAIVRERVKPVRDRNRDRGFREQWWRFGRPRPLMRNRISGLARYIAGNRIGKRILFCWSHPSVCPSDLTNVFAFEDDYAMGVLTSVVHTEWARARSSTLRMDIRYTPTSAFETFPWPEATREQRTAIGDLAAHVIRHRQAICLDRTIGLTTLYNQVEEGAWADLRALHEQLDEAVALAYRWPASVARDPEDANARLSALNAEIASGARPYDPFPASDPAGALS